jgi:dipeptidyl aminopeptidase/acylaminoacyl peptidase
MFRPLRLFFIIPLILGLNACDKPEKAPIPIINFFKAPEESDYKISPDGQYVSYLKPYKDKLNIFIKSLADGSETMATSFTNYSVRGDYFWTDNNNVVFFQDLISVDETKMFVLDVPTLKIANLLSSREKGRINFVSKNQFEPDVLNIRMNSRDPANFDVYRINIKTGALTTYLINPGNITQWYPDDDGKIRLVRESDGVNESILFRENDHSPFKKIIANNFKTTVVPIAFTGEKQYFYALSNVDRDKVALVEINAEDGKEQKVIYACAKADIQTAEYSKIKHRLELLSWQEPGIKKYFLSKYIQYIYDKIAHDLPGYEINIIGRDTAESKFIVNCYTDRNPGSFYLYLKDSSKLIKLGDVNSVLKPAELGPMQPVSYKASDGMMINGYLTLPLGPKKTNLPLVVMPHDGPFNQSFLWGYYPEVQFLANRGYAVLQVNFRGSTGFGKAYHIAGFKEVGGKVQQDITDGVHWLIQNKTANPKNIAIFGSGFGGFSALYGLSFHPGLYNCAVVQHGLINFFTYIKDGPPYLKPYANMTYEMVGDPEKDAVELRAISPVFHTDKIKAPLLIFQGAKDLRVNISELNQFVRELQKQNGNAKVKYFLKQNERTVFRSEVNRMEMYSEIESFLDKNMHVK